MTDLKLTYFPIPGLAQSLRLALVAGGLDFQDERVEQATVNERRAAGELPYGQLPVLTVDGVPFAQSNAILRYIGRRTGMYPQDDMLASMTVDGVLDAMQDAMVHCFLLPDQRKEYVEEKLPRFFRAIDSIVKAGGGNFVLGDKMSIADIKLFSVAISYSTGEGIEGIPKDCLASYKYVQKLVKAVGANQKIAEWIKTHS